MRQIFPGYYQPTAADFNAMWREATIVLDTNVLLYVYKTPSQGREALLALLERLQGRIWIPYQVAMEFQVNRLGVIAAERKRVDAALFASEEALLEITKNLRELDLDAREIEVRSGELQSAIDDAKSRISDALSRARDVQMGVTHDDSIRDRIDVILEGKIGSAPENQESLDSTYKICAERYEIFLPPGFKDLVKGQDSKSDLYVMNGLKYQRRYGDALLWLQLLEHVKENNIKDVIMVTMDVKEDWWLRKEGMTLGPHPELISEMKRVGGVDRFWMYTLPRFLEQSKDYINADVSNQALAEVNEAADRQWMSKASMQILDKGNARSYEYGRMFEVAAEVAVLEWLQYEGVDVVPNGNKYPDLIIKRNGGDLGVEVLRVDGFPIQESRLHMRLLEAEGAVRKGRLVSMVLVLVASSELLIELRESRYSDLEAKVYIPLKRLTSLMKNVGLAFGGMDSGSFVPIFVLPPESGKPSAVDNMERIF